MSLEKQDFELSDKGLEALNRVIREISEDYHKNSPQEDPLDGLSVVFNFIPGFGRQVEVNLAGRCVDVEC